MERACPRSARSDTAQCPYHRPFVPLSDSRPRQCARVVPTCSRTPGLVERIGSAQSLATCSIPLQLVPAYPPASSRIVIPTHPSSPSLLRLPSQGRSSFARTAAAVTTMAALMCVAALAARQHTATSISATHRAVLIQTAAHVREALALDVSLAVSFSLSLSLACCFFLALSIPANPFRPNPFTCALPVLTVDAVSRLLLIAPPPPARLPRTPTWCTAGL
jgi:hypothetical protein